SRRWGWGGNRGHPAGRDKKTYLYPGGRNKHGLAACFNSAHVFWKPKKSARNGCPPVLQSNGCGPWPGEVRHGAESWWEARRPASALPHRSRSSKSFIPGGPPTSSRRSCTTGRKTHGRECASALPTSRDNLAASGPKPVEPAGGSISPERTQRRWRGGRRQPWNRRIARRGKSIRRKSACALDPHYVHRPERARVRVWPKPGAARPATSSSASTPPTTAA